jgi:hypothetical protein
MSRDEGTTPVNAPHLQPGPVAFVVVCSVGVGLAVRGLVTLRIGTEQWWVGVMALAIVLPALAFIEGGWLWIQREVAFSDGAIVVRRWIEVLRGKPGRVIPLDGEVRARTTMENIRSLRIEHDGRLEVRFTLGYWEPKRVRELVDALSANGVVVSEHGDGDYR